MNGDLFSILNLRNLKGNPCFVPLHHSKRSVVMKNLLVLVCFFTTTTEWISGQVGVNTATPAGPFHVYSDGTLTPGGLVIFGDTSSNYMILDFDRAQSYFFDGLFDLPTDLLLQPDGGDVGINLENPDAALHVFSEGDINLSGGLALLGNRTKGHMEFDFDRIQVFFDNNPLTMHLQPNGGNLNIDNTTLYVNGSANSVGVGTTNLPARLTVVGEGNTSATTAFQVRNSSLTTALIVEDDGQVGIGGLTNPLYDLHVQDDIYSNDNIIAEDNLQGTNVLVASDIRHTSDEHTEIKFFADEIVLAAGGVDMIEIDQDINRIAISDFAYFETDDEHFGIGVSTPSADLHIRQNNCLNCGIRIENPSLEDWRININANGILEMWFQGAKVGQFEEDGEYVQVSDRTRKTRISDLGSVLPAMTQLKPARYDYVTPDDTLENRIGLIAQEVAVHFPEMVSYDPDQDLHLVHYSQLGVLAVKAIQELEMENRELEARIEKLEEMMNTLLSKADGK